MSDKLIATPLAELFGAAPSIGDPKLSPDGSRMAFLQQNESGVIVLRALDFEDGSIASLLTGSESGHDIHACEFANSTRLLCELRAGWGQDPLDYKLWVALDSDGSDLLRLPRGIGCGDVYALRDTYRIDWLPDDSEHILFTCSRATELVNVYDGSMTRTFADFAAKQLYTDGRGFVDLYLGSVEGEDRWFVRDSEDSDWTLIHRADPVAFDDPFRPVGFDAEANAALHIGWNESTQTWGLFARAFGNLDDRLLFADPDVDAELVNTLGPHERVVSVAYLEDRTRWHIVDQRIAEVHAAVTSRLPGFDVEILDESSDGRMYLARTKAFRRAGELILVDMDNDAIRYIGPEYAHLADYELAETRLISFESRDGGRITGQLTLPSSASGAVPAVIIPRGEAAHSEIADPHYLIEFLAASGYAVLRVNQRAPQAYGGWLPSRAELGWEQAADDIADAASALVESGIAEEDKLCLAGKDYGAYASLMSVIRYPNRFRCVISIGGVIDPREGPGPLDIRYVGNTFDKLPTWMRLALRSSAIPDEKSEVAESPEPYAREETSPIERAGEIEVPVLLFQGKRDTRVQPGTHAVAFASALKAADKDFELVEYRYDDHLIERWPYRVDMLARAAEFLRRAFESRSAE
jgi:dipeptidyl aminopeptidase/acylaminoacyl peptidase